MHSITTQATIDIGEEKRVVCNHFKTVRNLIPDNFLVTDSNDEVLQAAKNVASVICRKGSCGIATIKISTHIYIDKADNGTCYRYAEHFISYGDSENVTKLREEF